MCQRLVVIQGSWTDSLKTNLLRHVLGNQRIWYFPKDRSHNWCLFPRWHFPRPTTQRGHIDFIFQDHTLQQRGAPTSLLQSECGQFIFQSGANSSFFNALVKILTLASWYFSRLMFHMNVRYWVFGKAKLKILKVLALKWEDGLHRCRNSRFLQNQKLIKFQRQLRFIVVKKLKLLY